MLICSILFSYKPYIAHCVKLFNGFLRIIIKQSFAGIQWSVEWRAQRLGQSAADFFFHVSGYWFTHPALLDVQWGKPLDGDSFQRWGKIRPVRANGFESCEGLLLWQTQSASSKCDYLCCSSLYMGQWQIRMLETIKGEMLYVSPFFTLVLYIIAVWFCE